MNYFAPFPNSETYDIACNLAEVMNISNRENILAGMAPDQVYGNTYSALTSLLISTFGEEVARKAIDSQTWCVSDFRGQIIPAIEEAIKEVEANIKSKLFDKFVDILEEEYPYPFNVDRRNGFIIFNCEGTGLRINLTNFNDVYKILGYEV